MTTASLQRCLLNVYKQALRQNQLVVADHLLSAIEACASPDDAPSDAVAEAYRALAAKAVAALPAAPMRSKRRP